MHILSWEIYQSSFNLFTDLSCSLGKLDANKCSKCLKNTYNFKMPATNWGNLSDDTSINFVYVDRFVQQACNTFTSIKKANFIYDANAACIHLDKCRIKAPNLVRSISRSEMLRMGRQVTSLRLNYDPEAAHVLTVHPLHCPATGRHVALLTLRRGEGGGVGCRSRHARRTRDYSYIIFRRLNIAQPREYFWGSQPGNSKGN